MKIFTLSSAAPVVAILLSVPTIDSSSETVIRSPSIDVSFVNTDPTDTNGSVLSKKNYKNGSKVRYKVRTFR